MAIKDFLKQNGYAGLVPGTLTLKFAADENILWRNAIIVNDENGVPTIEFSDKDIQGATAITKDYAFVSYARVWDAVNEKYNYTNATINQIDTSTISNGVSITETLLLADAEALGEDISGQTGTTMSVTRTVTDWPVVSCVEEVKKNEIVYDGSKDVTINLFNLNANKN